LVLTVPYVELDIENRYDSDNNSANDKYKSNKILCSTNFAHRPFSRINASARDFLTTLL